MLLGLVSSSILCPSAGAFYDSAGALPQTSEVKVAFEKDKMFLECSGVGVNLLFSLHKATPTYFMTFTFCN